MHKAMERAKEICSRVVVVVVVVVVGGAESKAAAPKQLNAWRTHEAARALITPWGKCAPLAELLTAEEGVTLSARPLADGVEVELAMEGSGRWAYGSYTRVHLVRGQCDARGATTEGGKEALELGLRRLALGDAPLPTLAELASSEEATLVERADEPALAAARLLVQLAREDAGEPSDEETKTGASVLGDAWPIQPDHPGRPTGSPAAIWPPAALAAATVRNPWLYNEAGEPFDAIFHFSVHPPSLLKKLGRWELWELRFRARLGGGLLAVYDTQTKQHRWLWATSYDNPVAVKDVRHFGVVGAHDGLVIIDNVFDGKHFPWVIDLARGVSREILGGGGVAPRITKDGVELGEGEATRKLAWSELRP